MSIHCRLSGDGELLPALISWLTTRVGHTGSTDARDYCPVGLGTSRIALALTGSITGSAESGKGRGRENADCSKAKSTLDRDMSAKPCVTKRRGELKWLTGYYKSSQGKAGARADRERGLYCMTLEMHVKPPCDLSVGMWQAVIHTTSPFTHHLAYCTASHTCHAHGLCYSASTSGFGRKGWASKGLHWPF